MAPGGELNIAEIPHESGAVRYRYMRTLSPDGKRWIRHGLFVEYLPDGTIVAEGSYDNGREQGEWKYFHPNGALAACGLYEKGAEHGVWRYWNTASLEEKSVRFEHGKERSVKAAKTPKTKTKTKSKSK